MARWVCFFFSPRDDVSRHTSRAKRPFLFLARFSIGSGLSSLQADSRTAEERPSLPPERCIALVGAIKYYGDSNRCHSLVRRSVNHCASPNTVAIFAQVDLPSRSGYGREQRERYHQFAAKVRSQDSLLRSLRADVTTMRRRLRTQGEVLSRQKDENEVVRRAAEQVIAAHSGARQKIPMARVRNVTHNLTWINLRWLTRWGVKVAADRVK